MSRGCVSGPETAQQCPQVLTDVMAGVCGCSVALKCWDAPLYCYNSSGHVCWYVFTHTSTGGPHIVGPEGAGWLRGRCRLPLMGLAQLCGMQFVNGAWDAFSTGGTVRPECSF